MSYTPLAVYSYLVNSPDKTIKDVLRRSGGGNEDDSAAASKPEGPLKETSDTGGAKSTLFQRS